MLTTLQLYDLNHSLAGSYLAGFDYPRQALNGIKNLILELGASLGEDYREVEPTVWVHKTATVAPTAFLGAPCIIGAGNAPSGIGAINVIVTAVCTLGSVLECAGIQDRTADVRVPRQHATL